MISASIFYVAVNAGLISRVTVQSPAYFPLAYASVLALAYSFPEWVVRYAYGEHAAFFRLNRAICLLFIVAFAVAQLLTGDAGP